MFFHLVRTVLTFFKIPPPPAASAVLTVRVMHYRNNSLGAIDNVKPTEKKCTT